MSTNSSTAANAGSAAFAAAAAAAAAAAPTPIAIITPPPPSSSSAAPASQRRGDYRQSAGPTGAWVVPPNRKRKAEDLFFSSNGDDDDDDDSNNNNNNTKTWPGRAAADIFLPPSAGAAGVALAANPAATTAAQAAQSAARRRQLHVADRFPNPRPAATRNAKNGLDAGNKRRCVAQATLHHHLRPLQTCFADVAVARRSGSGGGPLGVAKALAGLPGGDLGVHRPRPRQPVPVRGVSVGLPPPVGPRDGGLVFRMWPGRAVVLGERGRRKRGVVPAPLVGLGVGEDGEMRGWGWVVEKRGGSAGVVLVEKGEEERERERERAERERAEKALVAEWEEARALCPNWAELLAARAPAVGAEEERLRAEWEEARALCPNWAQLLAARV
ncbi:uncharacterized protein BKCO1_13000116 [Diplodia corticola]|uniref:Uncharacterized protein n=1 Tax=Diplodia corticola TaxID=236234 RepID=A0A1J9R664_9PEZI|nr:uncharacterized protein BKCO1_13000116 [Diplodia corticola]OJD36096.1 hypothetical protein BKCO1_13000116 [Diplodia corticola]